MKNICLLLVALCLYFPANSTWCQSILEDEARKLNDEWEVIFYTLPSSQQAEQYRVLLPKIKTLRTQYPYDAEPLILEGITLCTLVAAEWSFNALSNIEQAKNLFIKAIDLEPKAMEAAAYIALGNLYFRLPGWPISFGNNNYARQYLEAATRLYPDAVDANYFLGDLWLSEGAYDKALPYLEKAAKAEIRPGHPLADNHTREEARKALEAARKRENQRDNFFLQIVPSFFKR